MYRGSTVRDVLVAEHTFLASVRTGVGFVGDCTITDDEDDHAVSFTHHSIGPAAALLMGNGAFTLCFAMARYTTVL